VTIRCRHPVPSPEAVGFTTREGLREAAAKYPHLRPCPKYGWDWLYRTACAKCRDRLEVKLEVMVKDGRTENTYAREGYPRRVP